MFSLEGKVALITGATGGLGRATAVVLHKAGATVVVTGRRVEQLENLADELGVRVHVIPSDLSEPKNAVDLFAKAEQAAARVDILVCNAGITRDALMIKMTEEQFDEVINVNLKSVWMLCREGVKSMLSRRYGRIINISSVVGVAGNAGQTNYAAAKAGLIGMTKSIALECATRGITANCVAPGFIATPMTDVIPDKIKDVVKGRIPMRKFGVPDDIANAVLYLASDEANLITGQVLSVNAGMWM